jgi:murein DD-endopeptidase MepM/ murein hydrolase activator NlpD
MAHVARWDVIWMAVEKGLAALYFFHPLVRHALARRDDARERACDRLVVMIGGVDRRRYARDLLEVVRLGLNHVGAPAMADPGGARRLRRRLESILGPADDVGSTRVAAVAVVVAGLFLLPVAGTAAEGGRAAPVAATAPTDAMVERGLEWRDPLPAGRLTWAWGPGRDPFSGARVQHRGVDLAAPRGTPVGAAGPARVVVATASWAESPTSGTVVVLDHGDGWLTLYAHLDRVVVAAGDRVAAGAPIGEVGSTGRSTGPHLHFEVRHDGVAVDPATVIPGWADGH